MTVETTKTAAVAAERNAREAARIIMDRGARTGATPTEGILGETAQIILTLAEKRAQLVYRDDVERFQARLADMGDAVVRDAIGAAVQGEVSAIRAAIVGFDRDCRELVGLFLAEHTLAAWLEAQLDLQGLR